MCYGEGKKLSRKIKIILKLQVEQEREGNRAASVSEQSSLWPQIVPGWQPSCERLPTASWDVAGSGIGRMALRFASRCLFLFRCLCYCYTYAVVGKRWRSIIPVPSYKHETAANIAAVVG